MQAGLFGQFEDGETEQRFRRKERTARAPFVRLYAAVAMALMLAYALINPLYLGLGYELRFSAMLVPTLIVLAGYFGATYWSRYPQNPMIDFACLQAFAMLLTVDNVLLLGDFDNIHLSTHSSVTISRLIVMAFAAVALAGHQRLFIAWLGCHASYFLAILVFDSSGPVESIYAVLSYVSGAIVLLFVNWMLDRAHREAFLLTEALDAERAKTQELLYNVLPQMAAERLKAGQVVADSFSDASVVFIDVVGFSVLAKRVSPGHLIELLNAFFSLADRCAAEHGVEKVKTIGDAYLAISGGNAPAQNSADSAIAFADAVIAGLAAIGRQSGVELKVRVGIHSGPVVGGVIGETRMAYDYWGETLNIAARIEGTAQPNGIAVSESTFLRCHMKERFAAPEHMTLKGVGEMPVFRTLPPAEVVAISA